MNQPIEVLNHPALDQAPKTLRAALERALEYAKTHSLGSCIYRDGCGNTCIIGQFFTKKQLNHIVGGSLNKKCIRAVAEKLVRPTSKR